jgi:hypothetical protein
LDESLTWANHVNHIKKKISKGIGILCRARKVLQMKTLLTLYYSFIYPHIVYCIEVWGSTYDTYLTPLFKLQKKSLRIIVSASYRQETKPIFEKLKILNITKLYQYCVILFMFKFTSKSLPDMFDDFFHFNSNTHATRGQHLLQLPRCVNSFSQRRIRYTGAKLFNQANTITRQCSYQTYRKNLKTYLLTHTLNISSIPIIID